MPASDLHKLTSNKQTTRAARTQGVDAVSALLRGIIAREEFDLAFQPIYNLNTGTVEGLEVLTRFHGTPYRSPDVWFADADRVGMGVELEMAIIHRAVDVFSSVPDPVYLSINASAAAVESGLVAQALDGTPCCRTVLELTEHTDIGDEAVLLEQLSSIRSHGTRLALDDVGAGFSGLQQLVKLNPDIIKLDIALTSSIDTDPIRRSLAAAMMGFANETCAQVVAEGIETDCQLTTLVSLGVHCGQGYHLGRPSTFADALLAIGRAGENRIVENPVTAPSTRETAIDNEAAADLLRTTLDHMDQGILVVDGDLNVPILSQRAAELIDLPAAFASSPPSFRDVLAYQVKVGAISQEYMESSINTFIIGGHKLDEAHTYTRKTKSGRWLDVRTTPHPSGGFVRTFTDQTARHKAEELRKESDDAYAALFENAAVGIYRCNADGHPVRINPALVEMHGYSCEADMMQSMGNDLKDWYVEPGRRDVFRDKLNVDLRVTDFVSEINCHLTRKRVWVSESAWMIFDPDGQPAGYEGMIIDVTERKRTTDLIKHAADHDSLTGLPNRSKFNRTLGKLLESDARFVLMYLDLDRFKPVNDTYGHAKGDSLLVAVAKRLRNVLRDGSTLYRIGGDEFAVLLDNSDSTNSTAVADRMNDAVARAFLIDGHTISIGVSIGMADRDPGCRSASDLLLRADLALYEKKAHGKSIVPPHRVA